MAEVISRPDLVIQNLAVLTKPPTIIRQRMFVLPRKDHISLSVHMEPDLSEGGTNLFASLHRYLMPLLGGTDLVSHLR